VLKSESKKVEKSVLLGNIYRSVINHVISNIENLIYLIINLVETKNIIKVIIK